MPGGDPRGAEIGVGTDEHPPARVIGHHLVQIAGVSVAQVAGVIGLRGAERVVVEAGLVPFNHADYAPGRRFYFFDWDGIEFEVVSYD